MTPHPATRGSPSAATLPELPPGAPAVVVAVTAAGALAGRLQELGVVPGAEVTLLRTGPPLLLATRDARFALRAEEANAILVAET
ncbi:MAG: ferrous iron transport protein A [Planctomycetes bacterium]|nr:ferrous iron transport protein A [Planctomycetota bacterium]